MLLEKSYHFNEGKRLINTRGLRICDINRRFLSVGRRYFEEHLELFEIFRVENE